MSVSANVAPLLLSTRDAAKVLAISERTLYTLRKEGKVRAVTVGASHGLRYPVTELQRFIAAQTGGQQ